MRRTRVLHFIRRVARGGGAPRRTRDLLELIDRERFEYHVCTVRPLYPEDAIEELGGGLLFHPLNVTGNRRRIEAARIASGLVWTARRVQPDVLHTHNGTAWYTAATSFLNRRIKLKILDVNVGPSSGYLSGLNFAVQRWMVRRLGYRVVVHSRFVQAEIAQAFDIPSESTTLIPLGTDTVRLAIPDTSREVWRQRNDIREDTLVVLYVARLVASKNVDLYLQVARRVLQRADNCLFVVAGDGPLRDKLENVAKGNGLQHRVRFLGARRDMADIYHSSDIFLSTSDQETFGLAIVEAMAAGRPVVATAVGGVLDTVQHGGTGLLCPAGDGAALAEATLQILQDPAFRQRLGIAAQRRARRLFDRRVMVRKYEELYRQAHNHVAKLSL